MPSQRESRSRYIVPVLATLIAISFICLSAVTAYRFGHLLGTSETSREIWGGAGIAIAAFKAVLPFALAAAWLHGRWVSFVTTLAAICFCCAYTLVASYSVASADRAPAVASAASESVRQARIRELGSPRPESVLRPLIDVERDRATRAALVSEMARYRERSMLEQLAPETVAGTTETAVQSIADAIGVPSDRVRAALVIILAICLELGEVAGLYLAAIMFPAPRERAVAPAVAGPALEVVAAEPAMVCERRADPLSRPAARATSAIDGWLDQYLVNAPVVIDSADAWNSYTAWCVDQKIKKVPRLKFGGLLRDVMTSMGAEKRSIDGRLTYARAA